MPALTAAHWGTYELVMRAGAPVGQARDDYDIFSGLAERLGGRSAAVSRSLSIAAMHAGSGCRRCRGPGLERRQLTA